MHLKNQNADGQDFKNKAEVKVKVKKILNLSLNLNLLFICIFLVQQVDSQL